MPKFTTILIAIFFIVGAAYGAYVIKVMFFNQISTEYDIRQANWGMSPEQVRTTENPELESGVGGNFIFYEDKVAGYDAVISYMFGGNPDSLILISGNIDLTADGLNPNVGLEDYKTIKEYLTSGYGKPIAEVDVDMGAGLIKTASWETKSTDIALSISDILGDGEFQIDISFISKKHKSEIESTLDL